MSRKQQYPDFDTEPGRGTSFSLRTGGTLQPSNSRKRPVKLKPLGKGQFARAFVTTNRKKPYVVSFVDSDSPDKSKEVYAFACRFASRRDKHLPCMEQVGYFQSGRKDYLMFAMPLYAAPLRKTTAPKAYAQAKILQECWEEAHKIHRRKHPGFSHRDVRDFYFDAQSFNQNVVKCARRKKLPGALVNSLKYIAEESLNWGPSYIFEFPMRNLGSDEKGNLILFDVIFDGWENYKAKYMQRR